MSDAIRPFAFVLRDALVKLRVDAIPPVERAVLLAIASYADPDGTNAFPSIAKLRAITGHSLSRITEAVKELADRGWLRCFERKTEEGGRTSTGYVVALDGRLWPESEARAKRKQACKLPPGGKAPPSPSGADTPYLRATQSPSAPHAEPPLRPTQSPSPSGAMYQPSTNPSDQPITSPIAHAREHTRGDRPAQMGIPFVATEDVQTRETSKAVEPPPKPKPAEKPPRKPTAAEGYADAFVQAFADRGRSVSRPTTNEITLLGKLCRDHAKARDGTLLVGDALPVWIRAQVRAMLDDVEDPSRHKGGVSVLGLRTWLDNRGGPVRVRELEPAPPPRPEVPPMPPRPPPNVPDEVTLDALLRLPSCPGTDEAIRTVRARIAAKHAAQPEAVSA